MGQLEFFPVDRRRFPSIQMAYDVLHRGQNAGAVFNTANEVAAAYFLAGRIGFADIFSVVARMLDKWDFRPLHRLEDVLETISLARKKTTEHIENEVIK